MGQKYNEKIIINDGKLVYAIQLSENSEKHYILMEHGKVKFGERYITEYAKFDFNEEAHSIAKEIFVSQLQADIKSKIGELKLLEEVFKSINMQECLGTTIPDSSKILLEAKKDIKQEVEKQVEVRVSMAEENLPNLVEEKIEENVKPIARKKEKNVGRRIEV